MQHTLRMSFLLCLALLCGPLSARCAAQAMQPEHYSFKVGSWELNAVKDTNDAFLGFWAIPRSALSVGNIRRMWFEAMPNDEWNVYAYEPVSAMQKAADLYNNAGMSEESLTFFYSRERKAIAAFSDQDVDGGVEGLIWKGFIEGDPLTETVAALSDPEPMIDLLADVIENKNILFGSEMVGAVRGIDPQTGHYFDDTKRYVDALDISEDERRAIFEGNARRVFPRLDALLKERGL